MYPFCSKYSLQKWLLLSIFAVAQSENAMFRRLFMGPASWPNSKYADGENAKTLLECSSACLSAGATCLAFSFESEECELGGDPGESPTQPSGTPTLPSFATKLVDGQKAVYAKKCKMASLLQSPDLSTCSELRIIDWMFLENPSITSYTLHSDFFNEPNRCDDGAIATVTWMNFWSGRNYIVGDYFVVDLGCCVTLRKVILRNSYNAWALPDGSSERATKNFRLLLLDEEIYVQGRETGWVAAVEDELASVHAEAFDEECASVTIREFEFDPLPARFVKFVADSYYGAGAGLAYIRFE